MSFSLDRCDPPYPVGALRAVLRTRAREQVSFDVVDLDAEFDDDRQFGERAVTAYPTAGGERRWTLSPPQPPADISRERATNSAPACVMSKSLSQPRLKDSAAGPRILIVLAYAASLGAVASRARVSATIRAAKAGSLTWAEASIGSPFSS